ncbi:type II toxin-antitoxin system RelE/ParE family toxin [Fodinicurvata sp. EGI_FJ10296]|uniref:type II toxin-antitoxin system RelE/ParE family toxin n=1 Tax=Fodinicurvata sp. EGI_FJ10296 TaxID=3231908 RepID=UPI0034570CEA
MINGLERCFTTLVAVHELARKRPEFSPPVRIHTHDRHLTIYTLKNDHILILRLLGGYQNWHALLTTLDS